MVFKTQSYYGHVIQLERKHSNSNLTSHMIFSKLLPSECLLNIILQNKSGNA